MRHVVFDSWSVRKWLFWLPCMLQGHPHWGESTHYLVAGPVYGCSCGRRRWNSEGKRLRAMEEA